MSEISLSTLEQIFENNNHGGAIRCSYSGRAMFGASCIGVIGSLGDVVRLASTIALDELHRELESSFPEDGFEDSDIDTVELIDRTSRIADGARMDSMGHDAIYYFPDYSVAEGWEDVADRYEPEEEY